MPDLNRSLLVESENADTLGGLTDVTITAPEEFQGLSYNGTQWVNSHIPVVSYVRNAEANTLTTGTVVYLFGGTGDHATVKRADNSSDATSSKTLGIVANPIATSQNGPVVTRGYVDGIDLSVGYSVGDILWLNANGGFTKTKPTSPAHLVFVGVVARASVNGIIYVAVQNGYELNELHDVNISNTLAAGDFLKYNGSLWVNGPITLGTDTTGNYMSNVSAGNLISISHTPGEGSTATINVANGTAGQIIVANASGAPVWVTESGDVTIDSSGVTSITSNVIVNADINTAAAIAHSKLANATAGQVLLGTTTTGVITATTVSGDVTITGGGVTAIGSGVIVDADVNASAAIAHSKLASITAGNVLLGNATNVPTSTTLTGDVTVNSSGVTAIGSGVVVNADINASAAIALSKLASGTSGQVPVANATGVPTYVTLSGDVTIAANGQTTIAANSVALGTDTTGNYVATITGTANEITVTGSGSESAAVTLSLPANVTIANNLTVTGDLTVNGNTTTLNTANLNVEDNFVLLNSGVTGSPTLNAGIEVERGTSTNVAIRWNETTDKWEFTVDGTTYTELGAGGATVSSTAPSSPTTGSLWFDSDDGKTYVYYDSSWVEIGGNPLGVTISDSAPSSPIAGQVWFNSNNAGTYVYYDSSWVEIGSSGLVSAVSATAPASPVTGQIWFNSEDAGTYIYYDSAWIEIGAAPFNTVLNQIDAKGDILVGTADNTLSKIALGTNGYVLAANSSTATGLEWTQVSSNPLTSNAAAIFIMDIGA